MPHAASGPPSGEVWAYWAFTSDLFAGAAHLDRAVAALTPAERVRHDRYRAGADRRRFAAGRLMARALVGRALGTAPDGWMWREGPHGRPEIAAPDTPLRFNLAHSGDLIVCALAAGREVGVDAEHLDRRPVDRQVVARCCSAEERADVDAAGDAGWHECFLVYWTLKEAYLKARGLGISVPLAGVSFTLGAGDIRLRLGDAPGGAGARWAFHLTRPTPRHLVAVAASTADGVRPVISLERWSPAGP